MDVGAAYHRQEVKPTRTHAVQRQVQRLVAMDVRKFFLADNLRQPLLCQAIAIRALERLQTHDANYSSFIAHRPRVKGARPGFFNSLLNGRLRAQCFCDLAHRMNDLALPQLLTRLRRRQMDTILVRQNLVNRLLLESRGNEKTHQVGNHQRHDDGIVSRDFEDHHYGRHGRAHDPGKCRAHPNERVSAGRADVIWQKVIGYVSDNPTEHGSEKQARSEDSTGVTGGVTGDYGEELQYKQQDHQLQRHVAVESFTHVFVAHAEELWHEPAHHSDGQSARHGLEPQGLFR